MIATFAFLGISVKWIIQVLPPIKVHSHADQDKRQTKVNFEPRLVILVVLSPTRQIAIGCRSLRHAMFPVSLVYESWFRKPIARQAVSVSVSSLTIKLFVAHVSYRMVFSNSNSDQSEHSSRLSSLLHHDQSNDERRQEERRLFDIPSLMLDPEVGILLRSPLRT